MSGEKEMPNKIGCFFVFSTLLLSSVLSQSVGMTEIEKTFGTKGTWSPEQEVFKIVLPRKDIKVTIDGWETPPFMGLTSWIGFKNSRGKLLAMGDLVLFEDEVNPVISVLIQNEISITALHNHFFYDHPKVYFLHIEAHQETEKLLSGISKAFEEVRKIRSLNPQVSTSFGGPAVPSQSSISQKMIEEIFQVKSQTQEGMVKVVIGRKAKMHAPLGKEMGVSSWAAFAGTDDNALVAGDLALSENELKEVVEILRSANINIVAIHNHMIYETPRLIFLHYWGQGKAKILAENIKRALKKQK